MGSELHRRGTLVLSAALALMGVAIIARTIDSGGGVASIGVLLGALFVIGGLGRGWVTWKRR